MTHPLMAVTPLAPCELCGFEGELRPRFPLHRIFSCPSCGLVFHRSAEDPTPLYGESYFKGEEYLNYPGEKAIFTQNFIGYLRRLKRYAPKGRLLEIGCAYGFFLELAQRYWDVRGIDVTPSGVRHAQTLVGPSATLGDYLDLPEERDTCSVVCLWDTLEHLAHPVKTLAKAARALKPGGVLALTTGDIDSLMARLRGERWRLIHPPTHLFYFSRRTLERALRSMGLEVIEFSYIGYYRSYSAMLYRIFGLKGGGMSWVHRFLTLGGWIDFPIYLNLFDIMFVAARRPL